MSENLCPHFGECGGCQSQDVDYSAQIAAKEEMLRGLFGESWDGGIPVEGSPVIWHYRNKVDPAFGRKFYEQAPPKGFPRETVLGFKRKGRWYWPMEIEECRIGPEGLAELMASVRNWVSEEGLQAFDSRSGQGMLRVLLVREGKRTGQRMVVLVTRDGDINAESFVDAVQSAFPCTSIYRAIFRGLADVAAGDEVELLHGSPTIEEHLEVPDDAGSRELRFRLSPFSFFQTNTLGAERLYGHIRNWVRETSAGVLYDLYGGSGSIAFACSDLVEHVYSVESVEEASADGRYNAGENGIDNVSFHTDKVENYLRDVIAGPSELKSNSAVVLDPPRAGMHPKALRRLMELAPPRLMYVSCKPTVLAQELPTMLELYELTGIRAVDMFPHTRHVEVIAGFKLK